MVTNKSGSRRPVSDLVRAGSLAVTDGFVLGFNEAIQCIHEIPDFSYANRWTRAAALVFAAHLEKEFVGIELDVCKYFSIVETGEAKSVEIRRLLPDEGEYYKGSICFEPREAKICQTAPEVMSFAFHHGFLTAASFLAKMRETGEDLYIRDQALVFSHELRCEAHAFADIEGLFSYQPVGFFGKAPKIKSPDAEAQTPQRGTPPLHPKSHSMIFEEPQLRRRWAQAPLRGIHNRERSPLMRHVIFDGQRLKRLCYGMPVARKAARLYTAYWISEYWRTWRILRDANDEPIGLKYISSDPDDYRTGEDAGMTEEMWESYWEKEAEQWAIAKEIDQVSCFIDLS